MKIGIDTFGCDNGRSGLGSYLVSLVPQISASDAQIELFGPEIDRFTYSGETNASFKSVNVPDSLNMERLWHLFRLNKFASKNKYDVLLFPAAARLLPFNFNTKSVAVVNDILSNLLNDGRDGFYKKIIKKSLRKVDCIIASSEFIKSDLIKCGIDHPRIEVVHNGVNHKMFYSKTVDIENDVVDIKPFAIKKPYIIYPSRMESEQKKHIELITAFSVFKEKTGLPHRLVIAGSEGRYAEAVRTAAKLSPYASDIFITGYFPHENFPDLYRNAECCVFPSVNEGVALPVIEAMASGIPVACSDKGVHREIAGEGAFYFNSDSTDDIVGAIEKVCLDTELRTSLIEKGLELSKKYSWETTAKKTLEIINSLF